MNTIAESELILNPNGSVYHLHLRPEDIATTIITVGDPDRVHTVSQHFDHIELRRQKREFCTHTGTLNGKRLSVISTGIGTDNIDIVLNELDALVNIDLLNRTLKATHTPLTIVRIGTSGALQADLPVDSFVASSFGIGMDALLNFYDFSPNALETAVADILPHFNPKINPYVAQGSATLLHTLAHDLVQGITTTCCGFYGPQGRELRLKPAIGNLLDQLQAVQHPNYRLTNFEMETAGIYGMSRLLGHEALSLSVILANRVKGTFSKTPKKSVQKLISLTLERLTQGKN